MAVYGNFLNVWSELFEFYDLYEATPLVGAGYKVKFVKKIRAILITATKDQLVNRNGLVHLSTIHTLYSNEELDLRNKFIKDKGKWHRAVRDGSWVKEGDFYITQVEQVEGNVEETEETSTSAEVIEGDF